MTILLLTDLDKTLFTSACKALPEIKHRIAASFENSATSLSHPCHQGFAHWQQHATLAAARYFPDHETF